jgi:hypothetical protein
MSQKVIAIPISFQNKSQIIMDTKIIYEFLTKYSLANRISCNNYITEIKSQKIKLTSDELIKLIAESKLNLQEEFSSNLNETIDLLNFDKNLKVKNPYAENQEINLLDYMICTTINVDNQWILEYFGNEISNS